MRTISFIGCGKLGTTLGLLFAAEKVFTIQDVLTTKQATADLAVDIIGAGRALSNFEQLRPADIFAITVPDARIVECIDRLMECGLVGANTIVFHGSGALSSILLEPCALVGAATASAHPFASFANPFLSSANFPGTPCALEGNSAALEVLKEAFLRIGGEPFVLETQAKLLYHSGAVIASNYLVCLAERALQALDAAGIQRDLGNCLMLQLMRQTLINLETLSPKDALTGPISRGDMFLVQHQFAALEAASPSLAAFYAHLANETSELAGRAPPFDSWS